MSIVKGVSRITVEDGEPLDFSNGPVEFEVMVRIDQTGEVRSAGFVTGASWDELQGKAEALGKMLAEEMAYSEDCNCTSCQRHRQRVVN